MDISHEQQKPHVLTKIDLRIPILEYIPTNTLEISHSGKHRPKWIRPHNLRHTQTELSYLTPWDIHP
jgi:hypothetical protein